MTPRIVDVNKFSLNDKHNFHPSLLSHNKLNIEFKIKSGLLFDPLVCNQRKQVFSLVLLNII